MRKLSPVRELGPSDLHINETPCRSRRRVINTTEGLIRMPLQYHFHHHHLHRRFIDTWGAISVKNTGKRPHILSCEGEEKEEEEGEGKTEGGREKEETCVAE